ncbi:DUF6376 family protein [Aquibacillus kalidii]|uniref:DUF6376 family protein n=1 Tax=Aquibacillus kalidii TaxID=2762597 RepID=UPI001647BABC|nr:DUF6376 family protein [Aquibacillus kalidii]
MKKLAVLVGLLVLLSACSLVEEVDSSLDYLDKAKDQINSLSELSNEIPSLVDKSGSDPQTQKQLVEKLNNLKEDLKQFNQLEAPSVAEDVHQQITEKSEQLINEIDSVVENGNIAIERIENSKLVKTLNDVNELFNRIENLGLN